MNHWKTILQSTDIHKYNSKNIYIEIILKSSKHVKDGGQAEVKIDCWTKLFKIVNNQRLYSPQEEFTSNIYSNIEGKIYSYYPAELIFF